MLGLVLAACGGGAGDEPDAGGADCGLDCTGDEPDAGAGTVIDAGAAPECPPPNEDVISVSLANAELPDDLAEAAELPPTEEEGAADGAVPYEVVVEQVSASSAIPPMVCLPGLETEIVLRWGHLPPIVPPPASEWLDFSGHIAISKGTIELVRALRWEGADDPSDPRPREDFVAPQTDPRLLRFTSLIGSGSDGLLLRIRRPVVEPVALQIRVGQALQTMPLDQHHSLHIESGGWDLPVGQVEIDAYVQRETAGCYAVTGRIEGVWTYSGTALGSFSGEIVREGAAPQPIAFDGVDARGKYGNFAGTSGSAGATVEGYYGLREIFGEFAEEGPVVGRIVSSAGELEELFVAYYEDNGILGSVVYRRVPCDAPGAMHKSWFLF